MLEYMEDPFKKPEKMHWTGQTVLMQQLKITDRP
jgi:hypothetical protein